MKGKRGKRSKWHVRRPAVIGRSIRISARGWRRPHVPHESEAAPESTYHPPPMPSGMAEMSEHDNSVWPHPIFFAIVTAALTFIGTIAWLIAHSAPS